MRRTDFRAVAGLVAAVFLVVVPACDPGGDVLVVYTPHGRDLLEHFGERFEEAHPGIRVQWLDMGSQEILDRVRSERANPQGDVWWGAPDDMFVRAGGEGLLAPYRPPWADHLPSHARGEEERWFGTYLTPQVIAFNSEAVARAEAPRDWDEVLDERWRDQVLIREPLASGTMRAIFASIIYRESGDAEDPVAGYDWLLRLDAQTREYVLNPTLLYQKLARQEGLITLWNMPDIETLRSRTDFPIDYLIPESGTPVVVDGVAVIEGARNRELAEAFVGFVGSQEALQEAAEHFFRIPARDDLDPQDLPRWLQDALPRIRPMDVDRAVLLERTPEWMRHWDTRIRRRGRAEGYD